MSQVGNNGLQCKRKNLQRLEASRTKLKRIQPSFYYEDETCTAYQIEEIPSANHLMKSVHSCASFKSLSQSVQQQPSEQNTQIAIHNEKLLQYIQNGDFSKAKEILSDKSIQLNVNARAFDGWTPLMFAVNQKRPDLVQLLVSNDAQSTICNNQKRYPHHYAAIRGCAESLEIILKNGGDMVINERDRDGQTALHLAALYSRPQIIEILLYNGANINIKNNQLVPAQLLSSTYEIYQIFEKHNVKIDYNMPPVVFGGVLRKNSRYDYVQKMIEAQYKEIKITHNKPQNVLHEIQAERKIESMKRVSSFHQTLDNHTYTKTKLVKLVTRAISNVGPKNFQIVEMLGKGTFGQVFLVKEKQTEQLYAMKILDKNSALDDKVIRYTLTERKILTTIQHPFIIKMHYAFQTHSRLYLVLEYGKGGNLEKQIHSGQLTEDEIQKYAAEIILALETLHDNHIIYRDLKPQNVVIDEFGHTRLIDFGLAKIDFRDQRTNSFCGSYAYMPPEILIHRGYDRSIDWYLLGVLIYEMLYKIPPYFNREKDIMHKNILTGKLTFKDSTSRELQDLITRLLERVPENRLGFDFGAQEIKSHNFFANIDWDEVYEKKLQMPIPKIRRIFKDDDESDEELKFSSSEDEKTTKQGKKKVQSAVQLNQNKSSQRLAQWEFIRVSTRFLEYQ